MLKYDKEILDSFEKQSSSFFFFFLSVYFFLKSYLGQTKAVLKPIFMFSDSEGRGLTAGYKNPLLFNVLFLQICWKAR